MTGESGGGLALGVYASPIERKEYDGKRRRREGRDREREGERKRGGEAEDMNILRGDDSIHICKF